MRASVCAYIYKWHTQKKMHCHTEVLPEGPLSLRVTSKLTKTVQHGNRLMLEYKAQIIQNSNTDVESFLTWTLFSQEKISKSSHLLLK